MFSHAPFISGTQKLFALLISFVWLFGGLHAAKFPPFVIAAGVEASVKTEKK